MLSLIYACGLRRSELLQLDAGRYRAEQKPVKDKAIERIQGQDSTHL